MCVYINVLHPLPPLLSKSSSGTEGGLKKHYSEQKEELSGAYFSLKENFRLYYFREMFFFFLLNSTFYIPQGPSQWLPLQTAT